MATSHRVYSDLFSISEFVRQVSVVQGKNLLIDALREYFKKDVIYRYETDGFGFALTPDLTDLPPDIQEDRTTRIFIGDTFRYDIRFLPAIIVKYASGRTKHIGFNQNQTTKYRLDYVMDGYGNNSYLHVPTHTVFAGAWDQGFEIIIASESIPDREELTDIVSSFFIAKVRQEIFEAGLFIKDVSMGGEREEQWGNDNIYIQTINVDTYSEWRREIPIDQNDIIDTINFCFEYGLLGNTSVDKTFIDIND